MNNSKPRYLSKILLSKFCLFALIISLSLFSNHAVEPVTVQGNQIKFGNSDTPIAGNSFFWSNTGFNSEPFYNPEVVAWLKNDWNSKIVRAAVGVQEFGGYLSDPQGNTNRAKTVIDAAIQNDMYVIIDWHTHRAEDNLNEALAFFTDMAQTYGNNPHVIYEIYNEPINSDWNSAIKPYAETVIAAIRAIDPDNLIIVGTPFYSQEVDKAAANPITAFDNIAYTLHFYAGTHTQYLRDRAKAALDSGIALFVTEWGTVNADGNGAVATAETKRWIDFMKQNKLSHLNWAVNDKNEGASIVRPGAPSVGFWSASDLTASGTLVKNIMLDFNGASTNPPPPPPPPADPCASANSVSLPGTIEAENYCAQSGTQTENTTDIGNGQNVGYIDNGDWLEYKVNIPSSGLYKLEARVASANNGGDINFVVNNQNLASIVVNGTGNWQNWETKETTINLSAGEQILRLNLVTNSGFNINWLKVSEVDAPPPPPPPPPSNGNVSCDFVVTNDWGAAYVANITVSNNSSNAITSNWKVSWSFTDGSSLANSWNATLTGSNPYTMTPLSWNKTIPANGKTEFGVQVNRGSSNTLPVVTGSICN